MSFLRRIAVLLSVTLGMFVSSLILIYVLNWLDYEDVSNVLFVLYHDEQLRMIFALLAGVILLQNYTFYRYFSVNVHRDKIIAFDNPSGRVTVSLVAMEDLVRRMLIKNDEVKEVKPNIVASKKGLQVKIRLVLRSDVNIPELTSKLQNAVKQKIQDTIGLEESLDVSIYVGKISHERFKKQSTSKEKIPEEKSPTNVPFQGYRP